MYHVHHPVACLVSHGFFASCCLSSLPFFLLQGVLWHMPTNCRGPFRAKLEIWSTSVSGRWGKQGNNGRIQHTHAPFCRVLGFEYQLFGTRDYRGALYVAKPKYVRCQGKHDKTKLPPRSPHCCSASCPF